jgi:hypothetical protein
MKKRMGELGKLINTIAKCQKATKRSCGTTGTFQFVERLFQEVAERFSDLVDDLRPL